MKQKIAASLLCWCGSDKSYRGCHLDRDKQSPVEPYQITEQFKRQFSRKYCMHPQASPTACSQQIVNAHSISRSSTLNSIAEDGHVMQFHTSLQLLIKHGGRLKAQRIGVHQASTFTGLCHLHDCSTFSLIDQQITNLTTEHIFLLAYRAVCKEFFVKKAAMELSKFSKELDRGKDTSAQRLIQQFSYHRELGLRAGMRDLINQKEAYEKVLRHKNFDAISSFVIYLDHAPNLVCTVGFTPEVDFKGNRLQTYDLSKPIDMLTCSIVITPKGAAVVFAWLFEINQACTQIINSLDDMKTHLLPSAIVRLLFEHSENLFFSESWWNGLDDKAKLQIEDRANSFTDKPNNCLLDDGIRPVLWSVVGREKRLGQ